MSFSSGSLFPFQNLLPRMDNGHVPIESIQFQGQFKLCFEDIHLIPGKGKYTEQAEAMSKSKRVILVISHDYLKSAKYIK